MMMPSPGDIQAAARKGGLSRRWQDNILMLVLAGCLGIGLLLVVLDLSINWLQWSDSRAIRRMFNITREDGLASLFSVILTLVVALVIWIIYALSRYAGSGQNSTGWLVLGLFFTYMGIDDGAMVHERIGTAFKNSNESVELISYGWQYVVAPFFILMGLFMLWFLWRQGRASIRRDWLFLALCCLAMAMLLDFIEGMDDSYLMLAEARNWSVNTIAHFSKSLEEFLEMAGMSLMLIVFLNYLGTLTETIEIRIANWRITFHGGRLD